MFSTKMIGLEAANRMMKKVSGNLKKMETVNKSAIVWIDKWIQKNFAEQGKLAHGGSGWQKLADSTIKARERRRPGKANILEDVGWLKGKWRHFATAKMARIQSGVDYGVYHDSDKPRKKLPQRKILPRKKQIDADLEKIYRHFLSDTIRKAKRF